MGTILSNLGVDLTNIFGTIYNRSAWDKLKQYISSSTAQNLVADMTGGTTYTNVLLANGTVTKVFVDGELLDIRTIVQPNDSGVLTFGSAQTGVMHIEYLAA